MYMYIYKEKERERESKTRIEGYRTSKDNNFPTSLGRGLLQGIFLTKFDKIT